MGMEQFKARTKLKDTLPLLEQLQADLPSFEHECVKLYGPFPQKISHLTRMVHAIKHVCHTKPEEQLARLYIHVSRDKHAHERHQNATGRDIYLKSFELFLAYRNTQETQAKLARPLGGWIIKSLAPDVAGITKDEAKHVLHTLNATWQRPKIDNPS